MLKDIKDLTNEDIESLSDENREDIFKCIDTFDKTILDFAASIDSYVYKDNNFGTEYDLNYYKAQILRSISVNPNISATEIAKKLQRTPAYMSKMITELEDMGLLYREINPENRRFFILRLTDKGRAYDKASLDDSLKRLVDTVDILKDKGFTTEDIGKCREFLEILTSRLMSLS